jgi:hypothetical protein
MQTNKNTEGEREQNERIKASLLELVDWLNTPLAELEDVFDDREPLEFL